LIVQEQEEAIRTLVSYTPTKLGKKWITETTQPHGGLHNQEEFKKGVAMLTHCAHHFRNPRLFHVCFTGASIEIYLKVITRLCRGLAAAGVDYRYKGCLENDKEKGEHVHLMIVLGTEDQTHSFINHYESGEIEGESMLRKAVRHTWAECSTLDYQVNPPRRKEGKARVSFLQFSQSNADKFHDACDWLSYIYKARSKPARGQVYFSDRDR